MLFRSHPDHVTVLSRLSAAEVTQRQRDVAGLVLVDVRNPGEVEQGTIPGARHIGLPELLRRRGELDPSAPTLVFCAGGYRSAIASSLLRSHGFTDVSDIIGGYTAWAARPQDVPSVSATEGAAETNRDERPAMLLDVREVDEWAAGHAPNAVHVPMAEIPQRIAELPADRRIVCICRSGNRSGQVTAFLRHHGFDVVNLVGGSKAWVEQGLPFVNANGNPGIVL